MDNYKDILEAITKEYQECNSYNDCQEDNYNKIRFRFRPKTEYDSGGCKEICSHFFYQ